MLLDKEKYLDLLLKQGFLSYFHVIVILVADEALLVFYSGLSWIVDAFSLCGFCQEDSRAYSPIYLLTD